ncbi:hypothetical protein [Desulforhopalus singaporensis]|uniref:O-antigen ligase like membrane protein n=1 Tax=Desulforhopalus singaporensis TaxID=91360 RepID=A0A1H0UX68_9BACT|nr:hypothetical protein [Desulforhopalus singaporensis]SDP70859.1 hypothetical protein SAMN05660330_03766 [Desulforhopalus singaporensis]
MRKIDRIDYFYFLIVIIYAAMAVPATKSMVRPEGGGLVAYIIPWGLTFFMAIKHRVNFINNKLIYVVAVYGIWVILQTYKYSCFYDGSAIFFGNILIAYILIKIYDIRMFTMYEQIVVALSVLAIFGWILQTTTPLPFTAFMRATSVYDFGPDSTLEASNLFFSLSNFKLNVESILPRNAGFSWEAGRYASMVIFAMFFNLVRYRFRIKRNWAFWILCLALLTTQSTTGFGAFLFLIYVAIQNWKVKFKSIYKVIIIVPLLIGTVSLPFVGEKISDLWFSDVNMARLIEIAKYHEAAGDLERSIVPQRFDSLALHLMNIKDDPLLGYGIAPDNSFVRSEISSILSPTGGIITNFAQFGILLGLWAFYQLYLSSRFFSQLYNYKGTWALGVIFALLSVSYSFWFVPFFSSMWMFFLFKKRDSLCLKQC